MKLLLKLYGNSPPVRPDLHAAIKQLVAAERVKRSDKFSGMVVERLVALFKLIKLLNHGNGHHNVVLLELIDTGAVMEYHISVKDKNLLFPLCHRRLSTEVHAVCCKVP